MGTTIEKFITNDPKENKLFTKEYNDFLLSEFVLQKMEEENISIRELAKKAGVSPTVIQKMRSKNSEKITYRTFTNVLNILGYKVNIEKINI
jgi:transcriptional regulator with XRE-family HTH domain